MPLTRQQLAAALAHVIAISTDANQVTVLTSALNHEGIRGILDFIALSPDDIDNFEYIEPGQQLPIELPKKDKRSLKSTLRFSQHQYQQDPTMNWLLLTEDSYLDYQQDVAPYANYQPPVVTSAATTPAPSTQAALPATFLSHIKVDIKQYPLFDGSRTKWLSFKRNVVALAVTHDLDDIFDVNLVPPLPSDPIYSLYNSKNKFVYSIWSNRITGGAPLALICNFEATKDGRAVYEGLLSIYESVHNLELIALDAMTRLQEVKLTHKTPGGADTFILKFNDAVNDLRDAGKPLDALLQKSMFLSKIEDSKYEAIKDNLLDDSSATISDCVTKIRDKYTRISSSNSAPTSQRRVNNTTTASDNDDDDPGLANQSNQYWLPPNLWRMLSADDKTILVNANKIHWAAMAGNYTPSLSGQRNNSNNGGNSGNRRNNNGSNRSSNNNNSTVPGSNYQKQMNAMFKEAANDFFQSQYGANTVASPSAAPADDPGASLPAAPTTVVHANYAGKAATIPAAIATPSIRAIMRSQMQNSKSISDSSSSDNYFTSVPSTTRHTIIHAARIVHITNMSTASSDLALVDSGADTVLLGNAFHITGILDSTVDVIGYDGSCTHAVLKLVQVLLLQKWTIQCICWRYIKVSLWIKTSHCCQPIRSEHFSIWSMTHLLGMAVLRIL